MHVHIKKSKIKRWLSHPDCPAFVKQCKLIFDKALGTSVEDKTPASSAFMSTPLELKSLIPDATVALLARQSVGELMFSRKSTHVGNSLILFHPDGRKNIPATPGSIEYIIARKDQSTIFAVRRQSLAPPGTNDPFRHYPHFHASVFSSTLSPNLELVKLDWVKSHYGRWKMNDELVAVLSLSRVCRLLFFVALFMSEILIHREDNLPDGCYSVKCKITNKKGRRCWRVGVFS